MGREDHDPACGGCRLCTRLVCIQLGQAPGPYQLVGPFTSLEEAEAFMMQQLESEKTAFAGYVGLTWPEKFSGYAAYMREVCEGQLELAEQYEAEAFARATKGRDKEGLN